ncbi:hypothetical protein SAMN05216174_12319 [Actinokineospora iranica]|uniref:Uncharacterized protein n=2 Tax=Actinokineospora iranica TaxID=1271860 RepID=A0A1G6YS59_9PSEU|nr:hypothetical protein SAMN05216174_12319 [Actinokineospora iranica]
MNVSRSRKSRRVAVRVIAAVAVGAAVAGGLYFTGAATAGQTTAAGSFGCTLPDGERVDVPVEFGLTVPSTAVAGDAVTAEPTAKLTLPAAVVDALRGGGTTVDTAVRPKLALHQGDAPQNLQVADLTSSNPLPGGGELGVVAIGKTVTFTPAEGEAKVELSGLDATLRSGGLTVDCAANPGAGALGTVNVTPRAAQAPAAPQAPAENRALAQPPVTAQGLMYYFDLTATTRIAKLKTNVVLTGALATDIEIAAPGPEGNKMTGTIDLKPTEAYLVVFKFMPVTNKLSGQGTVNGFATIAPDKDGDLAATLKKTTAEVTLKVLEVRQDGVDLKVGPNCRTATPLKLSMEGAVKLPEGKRSVLKSVAAIPAFTGCGTTENLDKLISGLVSGPGNEVENVLVSRGTTAPAP